MDEEDLADAAESERVVTKDQFSQLGEIGTDSELALHASTGFSEDSIGKRMLKHMGWREGQGVGSKIRRAARFDEDYGDSSDKSTFLFAPEKSKVLLIQRKDDLKGLGWEKSKVGSKISARMAQSPQVQAHVRKPLKSVSKSTARRVNITGTRLSDSDSDEDTYNLGPQISMRSKPQRDRSANELSLSLIRPTIKRPVAPSKSTAGRPRQLGATQPGQNDRCHDGKPPLTGFVLAKHRAPLHDGNFPLPAIPKDWQPNSIRSTESSSQNQVPTTGTASKLDIKTRGDMLGEVPIAGRSVFDHVSNESKERLRKLYERHNGLQTSIDVNVGLPISDAVKGIQEHTENMPTVSKEIAAEALARSKKTGMPYHDDVAKLGRYHAYLESQIHNKTLQRTSTMTLSDWSRELHEFANVARSFKPLSGFIASRFTHASTSSTDEDSSISKVTSQSRDLLTPAEEAARMNMFGPATRTTTTWLPAKLLCKRFGIEQPYVASDFQEPADSYSKDHVRPDYNDSGYTASSNAMQQPSNTDYNRGAKVDVEYNPALEIQKASEDVFKDIFGD
jgi:G patch domain-containing protein 1